MNTCKICGIKVSERFNGYCKVHKVAQQLRTPLPATMLGRSVIRGIQAVLQPPKPPT
jgi:hypothetical protein